jgi:riboflavin kinase/FMN adenylyltransferase
MKVISPDEAGDIRFNRLSLALGTFDGLHVGHMALIEAVKSGGGESAVFTFDSLPAEFFSGDPRPMRLFTLEEKTEALRSAGVDYLCAVHFDRALAGMRHEAFEEMICSIFSPERVIAGYNFTYGRHAHGSVDTLQLAGEALGFEVSVIPPVIVEGEPVSSTRIRECIAAGSIERANKLLGYAYSLSGTVGKGRGIGRRLLYPTANILVKKEKLLPRKGVYDVDIIVGGCRRRGVCNIGVNPTVSRKKRESVEAHIIGLDRDIYDEKITLRFNRRIRDEIKFSDTELLREQIARDIESVAKER